MLELFQLCLPTKRPSSMQQYYVNYKLVSKRLANISWEELITNDIDESWSNVKTVILHAAKLCTRSFWAKQAKSLPFLTAETSKLINRKHWAWNHYRKKKTSENYQLSKTFCNQTTNHIKQLKRRFEEQLAEDFRDNPKFFWHYASQNAAAHTQSLICCTIVKQLLILSWKLKFSTNNSIYLFLQFQYCYSPIYDVLLFPYIWCIT